MEQIRTQRRCMIVDYSINNKKKKLSHEPIKNSIAIVETLSNELFYEIFEYLDVYHVFQAFSNLNTRFQNLLYHSSLPLKINLSSMSKSNFQDYNTNVIQHLKHRIASLYISNSLIGDHMFSPVRIASRFIRLETLIFDNIKLKYLINILGHLKSLKYLSSLVIVTFDHRRPFNEIFQRIFNLPALKYCKISLNTDYVDNGLRIVNNITSPIEHLVICDYFSLRDLNALLSYVPQLRRLKFDNFNECSFLQPEAFSCSVLNLTHVSININYITFDRFQFMAKNLFSQLDALRLSVNSDMCYLDAKHWENLIKLFMPRLRIFDFQYVDVIRKNTNDIQSIYDSLFKQFSSLFWVERNWLFDYQFFWKYAEKHVTFYSINPYRRKEYFIRRQLMEYVPPDYTKINTNFFEEVEIEDEKAIVTYGNRFRNATKLILSRGSRCSMFWVSINPRSILHIKHLTTVVINSNVFRLDQLIELLSFACNINTLTIGSYSIEDSHHTSFQQSEAFQSVSKTNNITRVTVQEGYHIETYKLFIALCPRMQHLSIYCTLGFNHALSTIESVLVDSKINAQQLCSLHITHFPKSRVKALKTLIESKTVLAQYLMKVVDYELYIWW